MRKQKTLKELTIKDNFMFGAVMSDEENCRRFLEMVLGFKIARIEVSKEQTFTYHPQYKGIRLDVYAKDEHNTCYNVEMQSTYEVSLGKRARYYQSQMDMEALLKGRYYSELPNSYVIFICNFDPFQRGKYCYTFRSICMEAPNIDLEDGRKIIFLSTEGKNDDEISSSLMKFLQFVKADLYESMEDFGDEYVLHLQKYIQKVKSSREMEERYMILQEMLRAEHDEGKNEGKTEGKAEAVLELLSDLGEIPADIQKRIADETDLKVLGEWLKLAAKSDSVEEFAEKM
ncbi:Rpn family recombination-promoting nuclease/putative transposase [Frisingicoccus sp.]|uniref:Rpn family recombination-promoting nuclease/putative transposase n=1 Tax=Frisingicoccus sp. TaxID=1918627 RepID=UPI002EAC601C|nr:Rpn family recombination-promoting nuclease/putative transposase [Frisingicoccus sp.]